MKIFNWVHKRFHHSALKDGFASNMKNIEPTISNADNQLMKQVALTDLLGGWKDGILTIGTLGCDPLKPFNQSKEYHALESEEDELEECEQDQHFEEGDDDGGDDDNDDNDECYNYNAEEDELNPLMHTAFEHSFEGDDVAAAAASANKLVVVVSPVPAVAVSESNCEAESEQKKKKKKGERITLADLFLADSDVKMKIDPITKVLIHQSQSSEKKATSVKAKHGLSFTKKLIPLVKKDNQHPIKDIKKLMKKMLKRKIHPELDVKNHKPEGHSAGINDDNHNHEANDTASLLPMH